MVRWARDEWQLHHEVAIYGQCHVNTRQERGPWYQYSSFMATSEIAIPELICFFLPRL